jgi:hypothetical protein
VEKGKEVADGWSRRERNDGKLRKLKIRLKGREKYGTAECIIGEIFEKLAHKRN